ncbi:ATP-grasp domain-containing protein [Crocosphaera subtropica]|nr:ATP-grasp domain-containing protein [Crocosphaera subtropica]
MDLLEYQAKELFHQVGIPVLPSQPIAQLSELKHLHIRYPVVLKSQVHSGGRGRAGGIRFVQNTIDAVAAAQAIFSLPILGEYPEVILAEARYDTQDEFFLSILLDYQLQRPVLMGSAKGGIDVETLLKHMHKVILDQGFSPFYARRLATKMGLRGPLIHGVSTILEKMYQLFIEKDLDLIEINPLAVSASGEVMALDGKITVNDMALSRHLDLLSFLSPKADQTSSVSPNQNIVTTPPQKPRWLGSKEKGGNVGIIANGLGLTLSTWDLMVNQKGQPLGAFIIEEKSSSKSLIKQLGIAVEKMLTLPEIQIILINIVSSEPTSALVAQGMLDYCQPTMVTPDSEERLSRPTGANSTRQRQINSSPNSNPIQWVLRLATGDIKSIETSLSDLPIYCFEDLSEAVKKTVALTQ